MLNIAVFVSGGGTNLQALIDAQNRGEIKNGKITFVLASNENAYALERAKKAGIESTVKCSPAMPKYLAIPTPIKEEKIQGTRAA